MKQLLRQIKHSDCSISRFLVIQDGLGNTHEIRIQAKQYIQLKKTKCFEFTESDFSNHTDNVSKGYTLE